MRALYRLGGLIAAGACWCSFLQSPVPDALAAGNAKPARVSQVLPEGCSVVGPVQGRVRAAGDVPDDAASKSATAELARQAAQLGGNLVVPSGLGHTLDTVTRYGHAFRCTPAAIASLSAAPRCKPGAVTLPATAQELMWGTTPSRIVRGPDCALRRVYAAGAKMPTLGVAEYHAYGSEECVADKSPTACRRRVALAQQKRRQSADRARGQLARALRIREETEAARVSAQAFTELSATFGASSKELADARREYPAARTRCQRDGACETFGSVPQASVASRRDSGTVELDQLRDQGRYADAVARAHQLAQAGMSMDPGLTTNRYLWQGARIALLDMGRVGEAIPILEGSSATLHKLYEGSRQGVGAGFGLAQLRVEPSDVANPLRTLALARLAQGDRAGAESALRSSCDLGGCGDVQRDLGHAVGKEQATLELALGRCPSALARLDDMRRSAAANQQRDARWADASLELAGAKLVCGDEQAAGPLFRDVVSENARLSALNAGESGASAGRDLGRRSTYMLLSWALAKPDPARLELALDATLALKGNLLALQRDAMRSAKPDEVSALNQSLAASYALLARAGEEAVAAEASGKAFTWSDDPWRFRQRADALERERARLAGIKETAALGIGKKLQQSLAPGRPLLEYVRFRSFKTDRSTPVRWGEERYAVFVLRAGSAPSLFDLGAAEPIDRLTDVLLDQIQGCASCPKRGLVLAASKASSSNAARDLYQRLVRPVLGALGGARDLYVAPDSTIWRVPFAALEDGSGKLLLDRGYVLRYLPTSQELTRSPSARVARSLLALGAPDYGPEVRTSTLQRFAPLPETQREVEDIAKLWSAQVLPNAQGDLRVGSMVSKAALLGAGQYGVVHVATHGWFLPSRLASRQDTRLFLTPDPAAVAPPMVRTGLALEGANRNLDGVVTALELSTLDLRATQLVVLSACETGRGEAKTGEGIYGLSRAFLGDGAETVVSTLWSVGDESARALMVAYYTRLLRKEERVLALHEAARELRNQARFHEPWFWAAFVAYGRGGPLRL